MNFETLCFFDVIHDDKNIDTIFSDLFLHKIFKNDINISFQSICIYFSDDLLSMIQ